MTIVTEHLEQRGIRFEVLPHDAAETALDEAKSLRMDPNEVLKAVVLDTDTGHALAVVPSSRRLDMDRVADVLGDPDVRLASEKEIARDFPEFELGAMPPVPTLLHVPMLVDPSVLEHAKVAFAAGSQRTSVRVPSDTLTRSGATVMIAPIVAPQAELSQAGPNEHAQLAEA